MPVGRACVVALGTFDGVHLGHKKLIKAAAGFAKKHKMPCVVTTFDPHPQQFIVPLRGLKLLTTLAERKKLVRSLVIDNVRVFKFNDTLRRLTYDQFVSKYLVKKLNASYVFVGYDYAFGYGRGGGIRDLKKLGRKYGFIVKTIKPFKHKNKLIKSSVIRKLISSGKFKRAVQFLGHPYILSGRVVHGTGRGREIGFPTANLFIDKHKLIPSHGVYVGKIKLKKCLVNIGSRPTFGAGDVQVEVFIPKFNGNLYDKTISVDLYSKLRDEEQFSDVNDLKRQIKKDIENLKRIVI